MKNTTVLHSIVGVAGAVMVGLVTLGIGQTAAPPAGVPPVSPAPVPTLPPTPATTPIPPVPIGAPSPPPLSPPKAGAGMPATSPGLPGFDAHAPGVPKPAPTPHAEEPNSSFKGEFQTREWKVSPDIFDDGHGGAIKAQDFLQQNGVSFPKGAFAMFSPATSTLVVKNLTDQMKVVEGIISPLQAAFPAKPTKERGVASVLPAYTGTALVRAPGAVNFPQSVISAQAPKGEAGVNSLYVASNGFPVTSIEVAQAHLAGELNQDPQAAASRYAAIVANFDAQRQAAATAVYSLGEAYRKMGRNAEARIQYARILREFVDFPELTRQSQRQLSATPSTRDEEGNPFGGRSDASDEERALLREELSLLEKEWQTTQERIKAGLAPTNEGLQLQRDILKLKQQLVRLPREANRTPTPAVEKHEPHGEVGGAAPPLQRR